MTIDQLCSLLVVSAIGVCQQLCPLFTLWLCPFIVVSTTSCVRYQLCVRQRSCPLPAVSATSHFRYQLFPLPALSAASCFRYSLFPLPVVSATCCCCFRYRCFNSTRYSRYPLFLLLPVVSATRCFRNQFPLIVVSAMCCFRYSLFPLPVVSATSCFTYQLGSLPDVSGTNCVTHIILCFPLLVVSASIQAFYQLSLHQVSPLPDESATTWIRYPLGPLSIPSANSLILCQMYATIQL